MKWMAEYFLAAWALHEACTSADTFCLLPAASADTAKHATSAVASVEINSFFMFVSPLPPNATETLNHASSFRKYFLSVRSEIIGPACLLTCGHRLPLSMHMSAFDPKRTYER